MPRSSISSVVCDVSGDVQNVLLEFDRRIRVDIVLPKELVDCHIGTSAIFDHAVRVWELDKRVNSIFARRDLRDPRQVDLHFHLNE